MIKKKKKQGWLADEQSDSVQWTGGAFLTQQLVRINMRETKATELPAGKAKRERERERDETNPSNPHVGFASQQLLVLSKNAQMCQIKVGSSSQHKELQTPFERNGAEADCTPESDCRMCTCTYELDKSGQRSSAALLQGKQDGTPLVDLSKYFAHTQFSGFIFFSN